jgi:hypothetical protein
MGLAAARFTGQEDVHAGAHDVESFALEHKSVL